MATTPSPPGSRSARRCVHDQHEPCAFTKQEAGIVVGAQPDGTDVWSARWTRDGEDECGGPFTRPPGAGRVAVGSPAGVR